MRKTILPILFFVTFFQFSPLTFAQGDLMIMPKRLVFDGSQRSQEINLANTGQDTAIYAISLINYKMTENGNFELIEIPEEGQRFALDFLRYYPRRVTLAPNEAQTIRVQLTRTGNLEEGEYRSHMYFRAIELQKALGEDDNNSSEGIAIQIKTIFGISIPVIIRHGKSTTAVNIRDLSLDLRNEMPKLSMTIHRKGNMSVYGNFSVSHVSPEGKSTIIGLVKGVSIYTPNMDRFFSMQLQKLDEIDLSKGKLEIIYSSNEEEVIASAQLLLPFKNNSL